MDLGSIGFLIISGLLISTAILMVTTKNLIHSLLYMFMFVISVTAMILYLNAVFLGIAELIIYNGGIVLLLAIGISSMPEGTVKRINSKLAFSLPIIILAVTSFLLIKMPSTQYSSALNYADFGAYLFQNYAGLLFVLAFTAIASIFSTIYIISRGEKA
ncbi:MAG: NADH-quinone oxidoreductase subunit J [Candidatus Parvarchaeota archaeon]|jgi:NADH-ubiquinone/plastoquinone oxidoreductase chain 6.|nr:NADH-quinone oxidoreductase subunit J [Candidatus Parvarchaeota archaeon]MCW1294790.1 NADH-quinone oxidoreductase subunit J [Candidatus Parvarchaeum tengchongense]MCW1295576.1 NADH-quinone oxidoreductase subunit J [Candidatus Parvarchaeum tengchongense]MCW1298969.1 NADH-quinone oxidoreductase subunit J [Candidatus Parvarchaeum tengchongense]MCW1312216.1 NADH-quinone oxidoreductase subunit J [Candidatus Parvarchaeum tengchongense]